MNRHEYINSTAKSSYINSLIEKYQLYSSENPLGTDLANIELTFLYEEIQNLGTYESQCQHYGRIFLELEGFKEFNAKYYKEHLEELPSFRQALYYNELITIQVFYEFINDLKNVDSKYFPNLAKSSIVRII